MPVEVVVAGPYTSTYAGVGVGMTRRGFELQHQTHGDLVNETDLYGDSLLDWVHRGLTCFVLTEARVYKPGSILPYYPWGAGLGDIASTLFPIGMLASAAASAFIMTGVAGTSAALNPATLTSSKSILPPGSNLSLMFDSRARSVPLRLFLMPVTQGGFERAFVTG